MKIDYDKPLIWWKDPKLILGFFLVILSFILGLWGKVWALIEAVRIGLNHTAWSELLKTRGGLVWLSSWLVMLLGVFLIGWETTKIIHYKIHHQVKKTAKGTYAMTKKIHKKGYHYTKHYTKKIHKKGMDKLAKATKKIADTIGQ